MKNAALLVLVVVGCVDGEAELAGDDLDVLPKLATNALTPAQLMGASFNPTALNQASVNTYAGNINGRASLPYVVGCALAAGTSITAYYTGEGGLPMQTTYVGEIGLAPAWKTTALTIAQQRLISGCVLARVNATGVSVTVSLRGPTTALAVTSTEAATYVKQEGAFFGNIFQGTNFYLAACKGSLATAPTNRRCAQPTGIGTHTECGFVYAGLCSDMCASGGYFTDCYAPNGVIYDNTVSAYIK